MRHHYKIIQAAGASGADDRPHRDLGGHHLLRGQGKEPDGAGDRTRRQEKASGWQDKVTGGEIRCRVGEGFE